MKLTTHQLLRLLTQASSSTLSPQMCILSELFLLVRWKHHMRSQQTLNLRKCYNISGRSHRMSTYNHRRHCWFMKNKLLTEELHRLLVKYRHWALLITIEYLTCIQQSRQHPYVLPSQRKNLSSRKLIKQKWSQYLLAKEQFRQLEYILQSRQSHH